MDNRNSTLLLEQLGQAHDTIKAINHNLTFKESDRTVLDNDSEQNLSAYELLEDIAQAMDRITKRAIQLSTIV